MRHARGSVGELKVGDWVGGGGLQDGERVSEALWWCGSVFESLRCSQDEGP